MLALDGVAFTIGSQERRMRFRYAALIALHDQWGEEFEKRVADAIIGQKVPDLVTIAVFASGRTPETLDALQAERQAIIDDSPAIRPLCLALEIAWAYAYHGFEAAKRFQESAKREAEEQAKVGQPAKKTFLSRFFSAFDTLTRTRSAAT